jgi:hypothetical protein
MRVRVSAATDGAVLPWRTFGPILAVHLFGSLGFSLAIPFLVFIVERRMNDPYTDQDLAAQDAMRKNWLEDRFFSDPFTTSVTPYEAWSLYSLPPEVKF